MAQITKAKKEEKWQIVQEKAFTGWMSQTLAKRQMTVADLRTDLEDGIAVINFFELLTRSTLREKYDRSPKNRIQKIQNCHLALKFIERETGITGYSAENIVDAQKDVRLLLGLLWTLYRKFRMAVQVVGSGKTSKSGPEELLLEWVKSLLSEKYPEIHITNYKNSFSDGLVYAALAREYDADAVGRSWEELKQMNSQDLLEFIMTHAEKKMGISRLLDVDEIVEGTVDDRALALYTSLFHTAFEAKKQMDEMQSRFGEAQGQVELEKKSREELVKMNYDLTATLAQTNVQMKDNEQRFDKTHEELVALREKFLEMQKLMEARDKELAALKMTAATLDREKGDLSAKNKAMEERNDQLVHQVEAIQVLGDEEQAKAKKLSAELKTVKEELAETARRLKQEQEAKEGDGRKLTQQLVEEEDKARKLNQEKSHLEEQVHEFEGQVEEMKTSLQRQTKQQRKAESMLKDHQELFKTNTVGLAVLRRNLDQHLDDIHRWKLYLEGSSTDVDDVDVAIDQLADEMAKMSFSEQLNLLSGKLETENVEMTKILQERLAKSKSKHDLEKKERHKEREKHRHHKDPSQ